MRGEQEGKFVLSWKSAAENVLATEAEELVQMVTHPKLLMGMTLVDLTCSELLARVTPNAANAISEVGGGFCNGGARITAQCNFDGGDCCTSTCMPVSSAELASNRATTADDCNSEEAGDGHRATRAVLQPPYDAVPPSCNGGGDSNPYRRLRGHAVLRPSGGGTSAQSEGCVDVRQARALRLDDPGHDESPLAKTSTRRRLPARKPAPQRKTAPQWNSGVTAFAMMLGSTLSYAALTVNVPVQDLDVTVDECIARTADKVVAADNDPCFEGGIVVPTDEIEVLIGPPADGAAVQVQTTGGRNFSFGASVIAVDVCSGLQVPAAETFVMKFQIFGQDSDECVRSGADM
eukprot:g18620.t1